MQKNDNKIKYWIVILTSLVLMAGVCFMFLNGKDIKEPIPVKVVTHEEKMESDKQYEILYYTQICDDGDGNHEKAREIRISNKMPRECRSCKEEIKEGAYKCPHCQTLNALHDRY